MAPQPGDPQYPEPRFPQYPGQPGGTPQLDWKAYLTDYLGIPADVAAIVDAIFREESDPGRAAFRAIAYIRGTDWYKQTYRGIGTGIQKGVVQDERGYRDYVNRVNQVFRQYYGRDATPDEIERFLDEGASVERIGLRGAGFANVQANRGDYQYLSGAFGGGRLTEEQLTALGEQEAGLDSALGENIQQSVQKALQRMQRVFQGQVATGVFGPAEAERKRRAPDVAR